MSLLEDNDKLKLAKAVLNHTKTVANEYIEKHAKSTPNVNGVDINEDKFYEIAMLEIEEDNKVKSTWARTLAQTDGNKEKLESTYIKLRVAELIQEEKESIALYQEFERAQKIAKEEEEKKLKEKNKILEQEQKRRQELEERRVSKEENKDSFNLIYLSTIVAIIIISLFIFTLKKF